MRTLQDIVDLAPNSVDSAWSIKTFSGGIVRFRFHKGKFEFTRGRKPYDLPVSIGAYTIIVNHFNECRKGKL